MAVHGGMVGSQDDEIEERILLDEFEAAIGAGDLRAHYQMLVSAHGRSVRGVEALVRWDHPQKGMLPPGVFLPAVEDSPLIGSLTDWVLDEALCQCASWRTAGWVVPVSVNLSVNLVNDPSLPERVGNALARHGLPAHLLTLEVTETAIMNRPDQVVEILAELRRLGVRLSVDDFGTGYTSLALLKNFRFDELKIDRSFISGVRTDQNDSAIVRSVLGLGHLLGLDVVAEGVEDAETANWLAEIGCDVLQGFHFAKPVPPNSLETAFTNSGQLGEGRVRYVSEHQALPVVVTRRFPATSAASGENVPEGKALDPDANFGSDADLELEDLLGVACGVLGAPAAVVSMLETDRHWARAQYGIDPVKLPPENEFWAYTLSCDDIMEVPDARYDERFSTASLVVGYPYARFCAGVPLVSKDGRTLGALNIMDSRPRTLTDEQRYYLRALGRLTVRQLDGRRAELLQQRVGTRIEQLTRLHRAPDAASAAEQIVDVAQQMLQSSGACLFLADAAGAVTFRMAALVGTSKNPADLSKLMVDSRDDRATSKAVRSREPVFVANVARSGMVASGLTDFFDMSSAFYLPVFTDDAVLGTVVAWWSQPETEPAAYPTSLALLLASEAATALSRLRALADLRSAAETDALTGLANRRGFTRELQMLPPGSTIVMMDLDHFRGVNEQYGHQAGDQVLKSFAAHLRAVLRNGDIAARWGGEEFAVALPSCDLDGATRVIQRLRQSWAPTDVAPTTFSAGLVALRDRETPEQAIDRVDGALAAAKASGRNRNSVHT